ncbi:MAG: dipeptidase, partial [Actinomycetia bacterium]|nr:dipeptidase [Actinomycetes bacterium]
SGAAAVAEVIEQIILVRRLCARYPDRLRLATTAAQVRAAFADGRIASLLGAEGGGCIAGSLTVLRALRRLGVRYLTLTHERNVGWADSCADAPDTGGLSEFGRQVVVTMNEIGMMVDLSHVAAATMRAALAASTRPVLFTHSSCRALTDNPRNVPDDVLAQLAGNGGVCMITFVPAFVSQEFSDWYDASAPWRVAHPDAGFAEYEAGHPAPTATLAQVADHIEHAREVAGVAHIGLGGDYDGASVMPVGLADVSGYPALLAELARRGWNDRELAALAGQNVLRVLADNEPGGGADGETVGGADGETVGGADNEAGPRTR